MTALRSSSSSSTKNDALFAQAMGATQEQNGDDTRTAFFYGTLMEPQVFFSVCYDDKSPPSDVRQRHAFTPAILHGYCRRRVRGADYPGMVEDAAHTVRGTVVSGITKAGLDRLDFFEGRQYDRRVVRPKLLVQAGDEATGDGNVEGEQIVTESYIFLDTRELEDKEWDFAEFKRDKLQKWTRAGYVFEDCDPNDTASVSAAV